MLPHESSSALLPRSCCCSPSRVSAELRWLRRRTMQRRSSRFLRRTAPVVMQVTNAKAGSRSSRSRLWLKEATLAPRSCPVISTVAASGVSPRVSKNHACRLKEPKAPAKQNWKPSRPGSRPELLVPAAKSPSPNAWSSPRSPQPRKPTRRYWPSHTVPMASTLRWLAMVESK